MRWRPDLPRPAKKLLQRDGATRPVLQPHAPQGARCDAPLGERACCPRAFIVLNLVCAIARGGTVYPEAYYSSSVYTAVQVVDMVD